MRTTGARAVSSSNGIGIVLELSNPGTLLLGIEQIFAKGAVSECRNKTLQGMFATLGYGEKAGSGIDKIRQGWASQKWRLAEDRGAAPARPGTADSADGQPVAGRVGGTLKGGPGRKSRRAERA
jgi:hypothetical protein